VPLSGKRSRKCCNAAQFWRFVELPRTIIPIASATSLSEYDAVDIDMDLVFAELPDSTPRYFVLARKSR
jgi:hypothetical protein